ncbi:MAG: RlmE family RNA methyltransferase [Gammaproteobacteria bacterium]
MARSKSSGRWLREHFDDEYVRRAQQDGWRSRAVFKLEEIDTKERLFRPAMNIIDLGAAPGAWSQYAAQRIGDSGRVLAIDLLEVVPMERVDVIRGDINDDVVFEAMLNHFGESGVDLVMSDMAPNMSGNRAVDQPRSVQLCEMAAEAARELLNPGGDLIMKAFEGAGIEELRRELRGRFTTLKTIKPKASRPRSPEIYLVARGSKGR